MRFETTETRFLRPVSGYALIDHVRSRIRNFLQLRAPEGESRTTKTNGIIIL
jgi:hypothetical protein